MYHSDTSAWYPTRRRPASRAGRPGGPGAGRGGPGLRRTAGCDVRWRTWRQGALSSTTGLPAGQRSPRCSPGTPRSPTSATLTPTCRKTRLTHVTYVYGDELGAYAGRVKQTRELDEMAAEYGEFRVYVVEVCQGCAWNHLAVSYVLGTGQPAARRGRRARSSR